MGRGLLLTEKLPQLQNLIKRDPEAYREEFLQQLNHFNDIRELFLSNPDEHAYNFRELVAFISSVAPCYRKETADFPAQLSFLLLENYSTLCLDTRKILVQNLVTLGHKGIITSIDLLKFLFPILPRTTSLTLRSFIRKAIFSVIRAANKCSNDHKLNRNVQDMLFAMVGQGVRSNGQQKLPSRLDSLGGQNPNEEAMWAILLTNVLWKKGMWTDSKTVTIMTLGCVHPVVKVQSAALHFFLGDNDETKEFDESELQAADLRSLYHRRKINKRTKSGERRFRKQINVARKIPHYDAQYAVSFPALQLLNDPQTFAEKLYDILINNEKHHSMRHRVLIMQVLSRAMGAHKLFVLGYYAYLIKYLSYRQLHIPTILVALAQSVHDLTPPDSLTPIIRKLAQEFVHPGVGTEVIAAGINTITEVCKRQPWAIEEDLLNDLVTYRKSRDKAVTVASRALLQLYREVNPGILKRQERGIEGSMKLSNGFQPLQYGHREDVAVLSIGELYNRSLSPDSGDDGRERWDVESYSEPTTTKESSEWIEVSHDDTVMLLSDSEGGVLTNYQDINKDKSAEFDTIKILTSADFALFNNLPISIGTSATETKKISIFKRKIMAIANDRKASQSEKSNYFTSEHEILGLQKKEKSSYNERMASIEKGREGREKFKSRKKVGKFAATSSTNKQKVKSKPIMMVLNSASLRRKKKASLREKQKLLRNKSKNYK